MDLRGKRVLVTGGAVRIGRAICEALAAKGCRVIVHYRRSTAEAAALMGILRRRGTQAFAVRGSLDSEASCRRVLNGAWDAAGGLDILVNNAGVFHKDGLLSTTPGKFLDEMKINFVAPVVLAREFAARIKAERSGKAGTLPVGRRRKEAGMGIQGKIVNLLDRRIVGRERGCLPYLLSKKMLAEFTRVAALELAPIISVNGVAPARYFRHRGKAPPM